MRFEYKVTVEVDRVEGKFESRESIGDQITEALESADPGSYVGDNDGTYETTDWDVAEITGGS